MTRTTVETVCIGTTATLFVYGCMLTLIVACRPVEDLLVNTLLPAAPVATAGYKASPAQKSNHVRVGGAEGGSATKEISRHDFAKMVAGEWIYDSEKNAVEVDLDRPDGSKDTTGGWYEIRAINLSPTRDLHGEWVTSRYNTADGQKSGKDSSGTWVVNHGLEGKEIKSNPDGSYTAALTVKPKRDSDEEALIQKNESLRAMALASSMQRFTLRGDELVVEVHAWDGPPGVGEMKLAPFRTYRRHRPAGR